MTSLLFFLPMDVRAAAEQNIATRAGQGCNRQSLWIEDGPVHWPRAPDAEHITPDSCWITAKELSAPTEQSPQELPAPLWIDVRPANQVAAQPLPGTIAMSLDRIAAKPFLKTEPLVLVGNGLDDRALNRTCMQLREAGFADVRALAGGWRAWIRSAQQASGAAMAPSDDLLPPQDFLAASHSAQWQLVAINLATEDVANLPQTPAAQYRGKTAELMRQLQGLLKRTTAAGQFHQITVIAPDAVQQEQLRNAWLVHSKKQKSRKVEADRIPEVLWLQGGWAAYSDFIHQQQQIHAALNRPRDSEGCGK